MCFHSVSQASRNAVARRYGVALQLPINSRSVETLPRSFFAREIPRYVEATWIR